MIPINILELCSEDFLAKFKETSEGNLIGPCPSCDKQDNYSFFFINPKTNVAYCGSSKTIFNCEEFFALLNGIITCKDGRGKI